MIRNWAEVILVFSFIANTLQTLHCVARWYYLWTGKRQGCIDSSAERRPPSCGQSSELLPVAENSTGTVCLRTWLSSQQHVSLPVWKMQNKLKTETNSCIFTILKWKGALTNGLYHTKITGSNQGLGVFLWRWGLTWGPEPGWGPWTHEAPQRHGGLGYWNHLYVRKNMTHFWLLNICKQRVILLNQDNVHIQRINNASNYCFQNWLICQFFCQWNI